MWAPRRRAGEVGSGGTARPMIRGVTWIGAVLFWAVQLTLLLVVGLPFVDTLLLAVLLVGLPALAIAQMPLAETAEIDRLPAYWGSIATLWLMGAACWLVGTREGGPAAVGVAAIPPLPFVAWTAALTGAGLAIIGLFRAVALRLEIEDSPVLQHLLPRTGREKAVFALLSVAAGVCEEVAFRGYAIPALTPAVGLGGAVAASSLVFGVLHGYQGVLGMVRTTLMGAALAAGFLASGSLWPAVVAHVLIDILAGIVLGERLLSPARPGGVHEGSHQGH